MDSRKNGNLAKLVAFFLIVTVLIMAIAFSASGWQGDETDQPESGNIATDDNADENTDGDTTPDNEEPPAPVYTHYITGLEITEEESLLKPLCIVYDAKAPMYGISSTLLTVEIPIEGGCTRLLAFTNSATSAGKVGAIAPTRNYISNIAYYFGGVPVHVGNDDSFIYAGIGELGDIIDFEKNSGYHYTEYGLYNYTNSDLLNAYIQNHGVSNIMASEPEMPYTIVPEGQKTYGSIKANTALIQFDKSSTTELIYSPTTGKYKIQKNGRSITDKLDDTTPSYDNAFILFSDATTHETADATELILDTVSGGNGYYLNGGYAEKITWTTTESGSLKMFAESGEQLSVNPGVSYIAFSKSSQSSSTKLA